MESREAPRSIRQGMSVQQIGTETLVYDERRHVAFCLNESSSVIWRLADGERTVAAIREVASIELKTIVSEEFVLFALVELRRDGLVEDFAAERASGVSRRVMLQRLGVSGALLLPAIASIVAPTAAQAYSGCFNCSSVSPARPARRRPPSGAQPGLSPLPGSPEQ
jgi:hypothetical protein